MLEKLDIKNSLECKLMSNKLFLAFPFTFCISLIDLQIHAISHIKKPTKIYKKTEIINFDKNKSSNSAVFNASTCSLQLIIRFTRSRISHLENQKKIHKNLTQKYSCNPKNSIQNPHFSYQKSKPFKHPKFSPSGPCPPPPVKR
jgi:hypothetical protein